MKFGLSDPTAELQESFKSVHHMDNLLVPYLTAADDREREQLLDELLTVQAAPLIRRVLRQRLGFYVTAQGVNENHQDAEDVYQDAMTRVVQVLKQLHSGSGSSIDNFRHYVSRIASNVCIDFLRAKSPARTRLKYSLRDLFRQHADLVCWEQGGEMLCGFSLWRNVRKCAFSDQSYEHIKLRLDDFQLFHFAEEDVRVAPLSQIVAELLNWIGGPVDIDVLVRMVAHLLDIRDQQLESLDNPAVPRWDRYFVAPTQSGEPHLEAHELLARLWRTVIQLPSEQRDSFAFGFEDEAGQDLFTVLLAAEIVNWDELAHGMGRSVQEVVRLRAQMPMNGASVAEELKASRENVYKWRFRAIRRLKTELTRVKK